MLSTPPMRCAGGYRPRGISPPGQKRRARLWVSASGEWLLNHLPVEVVSTVGAGDSMVGGLIYGLLMRDPASIPLRLATAVAAGCVGQSNVGNYRPYSWPR